MAFANENRLMLFSSTRTDSSLHEKLVRRSSLTSSEIIKLLASHDTLTKKLTCDYIIDRAHKDPELSLLTANLLLRDTNEANPAVRCVSLLALSSLPGMEEAAIAAVTKGFSDPSSQVRRASCICCLNLHRHSPSSVLESGMVDLLYEHIRDSDPTVTASSLFTLDKILLLQGTLIINKRIATYLFQKISEFPDCTLIYILNILTSYTPKDDEDLFNMINDLDYCLNSTSPSVLMAAMQVFLHLAKQYPLLTSDLIETIKPSICKTLNKNCYETNYLLIDYLQCSNSYLKLFFVDCFKIFLLKQKEPYYLKAKKCEVLPLIASDDNIRDIILDLEHYLSDFQCFKLAYNCMGMLGASQDKALQPIFAILEGVMHSSDPVVVAALECFLTIFIRRNGMSDSFNNYMSKNLIDNIVNAISRSNLHEYHSVLVLRTLQCIACYMNSAQELLQTLSHEMELWDLATQCLFVDTAAVVFIQFPLQTLPILSFVLHKAFNAPELQLRHHAAFVYAALEEGACEAKKLLAVSYSFKSS